MERPAIRTLACLLEQALVFTRSRRDCHVRGRVRDNASEIAGHASIAQPSRDPLPKVRPAGLEPATDGLENRCSIHLSYGRNRTGAARAVDRPTERNRSPPRRAAPGRIRTCDLRFRKPPLYPPELRARSLPSLDLRASNRFVSIGLQVVASDGDRQRCVAACDRGSALAMS